MTILPLVIAVVVVGG